MKLFVSMMLLSGLLYADVQHDNFVTNILKSSEVKIDFQELNSGKILSIAREDQEQTDSSIALSMVLYVKAPYKDVLSELQKSSSRLSNYKHAFCQEIKDPKNLKPYFKNAVLLKDEADELEKLIEYDGGNTFNLSKQEITWLNKLRSNKKKLATEFFRKVLINRTEQYMKNGISGISAYEHSDSGDTLGDGFKKSSLGMKVFQKEFADMYNYYIHYPKTKPTKEMSEKFFVLKDKVDGRVAFILKHQIIEQKKDITLIAERQFYISNSLNGIQTQILCTPYKNGTLVALSTQSYTDKVSGFSRSIAVKVGRAMMRQQILPMFETLEKKYNK